MPSFVIPPPSPTRRSTRNACELPRPAQLLARLRLAGSPRPRGCAPRLSGVLERPQPPRVAFQEAWREEAGYEAGSPKVQSGPDQKQIPLDPIITRGKWKKTPSLPVYGA